MAGISGFFNALNDHSEYKEGSESLNIVTEVDEKFNLPEDFESDITYTRGKTSSRKSTKVDKKKYGIGHMFNEDMNGTFLDKAFKLTQECLSKYKIKIKNMSDKSFRVTERDLYEFNAYIKSRSKEEPRLMQFFKSPKEYEDYMYEYQQDNINVTNDPAIIGNEKTFSTPTEKVVIVETTNPDKLVEIIQAIKDHGNGGHTFDIIMDEDSEEQFNWDGDGSDRIGEIKVEDNKSYSSSEKDWWVVAVAEYEDGDKEVRSAYQPQDHKPTKDEMQEFEGRGVELHLFKAFDDERSADKYAAELRGRLHKDRKLSRSYSEGACPDSGCIQKKPNGSWGIISNKTGEFWEQDYESEEKAKDALAAYHANKHFTDMEGAPIKIFSYGFNPDTAEVKGDGLYTMDNLIGSVLYSVSYTHLFHLTTQDYPSHIALNEYYDEMPDLVDALAEGWLSQQKDIYFQNSVLPADCPIDYLGRLKDFILVLQKEHQYSSAVNSQIDAIVELIDSTLYKLKRLSNHQAIFSEFDTEGDELTITPDEGRKRTARDGESPVEFIQRMKDEKLERIKHQEVDAYDATFSRLSKFSESTRKFLLGK